MVRGGALREGPDQKVSQREKTDSHASVVFAKEDRHTHVLRAAFI